MNCGGAVDFHRTPYEGTGAPSSAGSSTAGGRGDAAGHCHVSEPLCSHLRRNSAEGVLRLPTLAYPRLTIMPHKAMPQKQSSFHCGTHNLATKCHHALIFASFELVSGNSH